MRGNVEDGVRRLRDLLTRFEEISAAFAEPDADFDALIAEQAKVQEQIDRADAWSLDATIERAMDALRLPDGDRDVTTLSGGERRRVALARLLLSSPDLLAARRAHEPSRRRVGRVARALPRRLCGNRRRGHARPVLPRQRRGLDSGARPRQGHPVRGRTTRAGWSRSRPGSPGRRSRSRRAAARSRGSWNGCGHRRRRATRSRRRASRRTRSSSPRRRASSSTASRSTSPQDRASATSSSRPTGSRRASATGCCSRTCRFRCRPAGSSASSGRTARARRRSSG